MVTRLVFLSVLGSCGAECILLCLPVFVLSRRFIWQLLLSSGLQLSMALSAEGLRSRLRRATSTAEDRATHARDRRNSRQHGLSLQTIKNLAPGGLQTPWRSHRCIHCNALLLASESSSWCCSNGQKVLSPLPPLPARIQQLVSDLSEEISLRSRELNYLFSLSAIGVSGLTSGWSQYTGDVIFPTISAFVICLMSDRWRSILAGHGGSNISPCVLHGLDGV